MRIHLNGEDKVYPDGVSVSALVETLGWTAGRLACEVNGAVVRRADYAATVLKEGDRVEIVQMIGGG